MSGRVADSERPPLSARPCPICGRDSRAENRPFCSQRCADVDLNRWLSGAYVVPGGDDEEGGTERGDDG